MIKVGSLINLLALGTSVLSYGSATAVNDNSTNTTLPVNFGLVLYPAFQALDVFGPLDALNILSLNYSINLHLLSTTLDPVSTKVPSDLPVNKANSDFSESIVPTATFDNPPENLDVLIVPGGFGTHASDEVLAPRINFIRDTYPNLQYLITVCTGSWLAARAGVLDNRNATSNKAEWAVREGLGNNTNWIPHARWVQDGNVWTSSGVSAGLDVTFAWLEAVFGNETATNVAVILEYERHLNASEDPFADYWGL
ncbi:hypothetical protein VKT23_010463 [Stygiomarasmius scandens]|uniref:DJ-1/PfpI domain-containing protein n=1 Tax=Marasmiellus scandens TaxID=2682957 RepID=A0ABR1JFU3_9AGAR